MLGMMHIGVSKFIKKHVKSTIDFASLSFNSWHTLIEKASSAVSIGMSSSNMKMADRETWWSE